MRASAAPGAVPVASARVPCRRSSCATAGAIVVADVLLGRHEPREAIGEILRFVRALAGDDAIVIDRAVAEAELATGHRNMAQPVPRMDRRTDSRRFLRLHQSWESQGCCGDGMA